jgi:AraC-like DNA-binding protein
MGELVRTLILLGIVQGVVLAFVLASRSANRLANRILAALVGCVALMMTLGEIGRRWGFVGHPHLLGLAAPLPFLFGPLLYLYASALTRPLHRFDPRWLAHGIPFVADLLYMAEVFYSRPGDQKIALALAADAGQGPATYYAVGLLEIGQAFTYLALTWRALDRYGRKMTGYFSDLAKVDLRWLRALVGTHVAIWSLVLITSLLRWARHEPTALGPAVPIGSSLAIFLTGYISLWQPDLVQKATAARVADPEPESEPPKEREPEAEPEPKPGPEVRALPKYQRNRLDDDEARELITKLEALMTVEHLYKEAGLTLPILADRLGVAPHTLSQLLNVRVGKSFFVFVNTHRVEALKAALHHPAQAERGVLELAFEVGFSSKSTVNSFFKKVTGTTPTEFRNRKIEAESRG